MFNMLASTIQISNNNPTNTPTPTTAGARTKEAQETNQRLIPQDPTVRHTTQPHHPTNPFHTPSTPQGTNRQY